MSGIFFSTDIANSRGMIIVFVPLNLQGWTKFYEFSQSDLRAGADIIDRLCAGGRCPDFCLVFIYFFCSALSFEPVPDI